MTDFFFKAFIVTIIVALQIVFGVILPIWGPLPHPDLLIIIVIYLGFTYGSMTGQISGFFSGLALDVFYAHPSGWILVYTLLGFVIGLFHKRIYHDGIISILIMILLATVAKFIIHKVILLLFYPSIHLPDTIVMELSQHLPIEVVMNLILTIPLFFLLKWADARMHRTF